MPTQLGKHFWPDFSYVLGIRVDYLSPTLYLTDILLFFLILLSLPKAKIFKKVASYKNYVFAITLLILLGILTSKAPLSGAYSLLKILEFSILTLFVIERFKDVRKFFAPAFATGIIFESILSVAQLLKGGSIGGPIYYFGERFFSSSTPNIANAQIAGELVLRPYATFSHPNVLAAYILIGSFFILKESNFKKLNYFFYIIALGLGGLTIALTLSRVAILLYVLMLFVFLFRKKRFNISILFLLSPLIILGRDVILRYQSLFINDQSTYERLNLARASVKMFFENPLTGVGLGNFLHSLPYYYKSEVSLFLQPVHNTFLLIGSETGFIGLFIMLFVFILLFKRALGINLLLAFILLGLSLTDHFFLTLQQGQLLMALAIGYIFADKYS